MNAYGAGQAYYVASRNEQGFLDDFYAHLVRSLQIKRVLDSDLPYGVTAQLRAGGERKFIFVQNFTPAAVTVDLGRKTYTDWVTGRTVTADLELGAYGCSVLESRV